MCRMNDFAGWLKGQEAAVGAPLGWAYWAVNANSGDTVRRLQGYVRRMHGCRLRAHSSVLLSLQLHPYNDTPTGRHRVPQLADVHVGQAALPTRQDGAAALVPVDSTILLPEFLVLHCSKKNEVCVFRTPDKARSKRCARAQAAGCSCSCCVHVLHSQPGAAYCK